MISLKDIPVLVGLAGSVITGSFYVHDIKRDVAELSSDYRQHVAQQQETTLLERKWKLEDRMKTSPDENTRRELEEVTRQLEMNRVQQQQLKGGK